MSTFNDTQVAGNHYRKTEGEQHWDRVQRLGLDYFQAQITKYVERCWEKNGIEDLEKAQHFLGKYIELSKVHRWPGGDIAPRQGMAQSLNRAFVVHIKEERDLFEKRLHYLLTNEVLRMEGKFEWPAELHSNPFAEDPPVECLRGSMNDFEPEGSFGSGKTLWTCKHCRSKVYTEQTEVKPHAVHQPRGPACMEVQAQRTAAAADSPRERVKSLFTRVVADSHGQAQQMLARYGISKYADIADDQLAQFETDCTNYLSSTAPAETFFAAVEEAEVKLQAADPFLEQRLRVSSLLETARTNNRKAARAIFEKHAVTPLGKPNHVPDANLNALEADLQVHLQNLVAAEGDATTEG